MLVWLEANLATILTALVVFGLLALIVCAMIRDKKKGKSVTCGGCSGDCAHCRAAHAEAIRTARAAKANTGR